MSVFGGTLSLTQSILLVATYCMMQFVLHIGDIHRVLVYVLLKPYTFTCRSELHYSHHQQQFYMISEACNIVPVP